MEIRSRVSFRYNWQYFDEFENKQGRCTFSKSNFS